VPAPQSLQTEAAAAEYVENLPATVKAENLPASQMLQIAAPAAEYVPAPQSVQDGSCSREYVPAQLETSEKLTLKTLLVGTEKEFLTTNSYKP
jgi:hypothetical protein